MIIASIGSQPGRAIIGLASHLTLYLLQNALLCALFTCLVVILTRFALSIFDQIVICVIWFVLSRSLVLDINSEPLCPARALCKNQVQDLDSVDWVGR